MLSSTKLNEEGGNWKNLIMDIVCIVWNCLQSHNCSSLSISWAPQDGGGEEEGRYEGQEH